MIKEKLASRKLWIGVALVVIGVILCITGNTTHGIELICLGGCGYLGVEMICDIARAIWPTEVTIFDETEDSEDTETEEN